MCRRACILGVGSRSDGDPRFEACHVTEELAQQCLEGDFIPDEVEEVPWLAE